MNILELKEVDKSYQNQKALSNINLTVKEGEFIIISGPSGAGKSTLLNVIGRLDSIDSGKILFNDKNISKFQNKDLIDYLKNDVGFIFQFYNLLSNLNVVENVSLGLISKDNEKKALEILKLLNISNLKDKFPNELSGGEQQRVSIARALIKKPKLLLCDEPTGALDEKKGNEIIELLHKICKDEKITILLVTHNNNYFKYADRVVKLKDGRIIK